jgi:hypothetical protein
MFLSIVDHCGRAPAPELTMGMRFNTLSECVLCALSKRSYIFFFTCVGAGHTVLHPACSHTITTRLDVDSSVSRGQVLVRLW